LNILLVALPPPWAVARGAMVTKLYQFYKVSPIYKKVVLRLSEHGDVIETQIISIVPRANSVPALAR